MNRLWISDLGARNHEIEILIGNDNYGQLLTGRVTQIKSGLTAIQTKIGWTICGKIESLSQSYLITENSMLIKNLKLKEMKVKLETIGITHPCHTLY